MWTWTNYNDELYHHGIRGQKWGIRRWQNEDGSLTEAGRKRYGTVENLNAAREKRRKNLKTAGKVALGIGAAAAIGYGAHVLKARKKAILTNAQKAADIAESRRLGTAMSRINGQAAIDYNKAKNAVSALERSGAPSTAVTAARGKLASAAKNKSDTLKFVNHWSGVNKSSLKGFGSADSAWNSRTYLRWMNENGMLNTLVEGVVNPIKKNKTVGNWKF